MSLDDRTDRRLHKQMWDFVNEAGTDAEYAIRNARDIFTALLNGADPATVEILIRDWLTHNGE